MKVKRRLHDRAIVLQRYVWFQRGSAADGNGESTVEIRHCPAAVMLPPWWRKSERPPEIQLDEDRLALFACTQALEKGQRHRTSCCVGCITCRSRKRASPLWHG